MSGAIPLLLLYPFVVWIGTASTLLFYCSNFFIDSSLLYLQLVKYIFGGFCDILYKSIDVCVCVLQCCDLYHVPNVIIFVRFEVFMTVSGNITVP
jgi:hypothetical protein